MLQKSILKLYSSLQIKKYRQIHNLFVVEGRKPVEELLNSSFKVKHILHLPGFYPEPEFLKKKEVEVTELSGSEASKISSLKTSPPVMAIAEIPDPPESSVIDITGISIALEDIRDPGNLGTIIRLADWFGIKNIIASPETVDAFNPKVIQACMGSIFRVNVHYSNLYEYIKWYKKLSGNVVFGAVMNGNQIYTEKLPRDGLVVFGNEAHGLSESINLLIDKGLTIPRGMKNSGAESLNVAMAVAIICNEFGRAAFLEK